MRLAIRDYKNNKSSHVDYARLLHIAHGTHRIDVDYVNLYKIVSENKGKVESYTSTYNRATRRLKLKGYVSYDDLIKNYRLAGKTHMYDKSISSSNVNTGQNAVASSITGQGYLPSGMPAFSYSGPAPLLAGAKPLSINNPSSIVPSNQPIGQRTCLGDRKWDDLVVQFGDRFVMVDDLPKHVACEYYTDGTIRLGSPHRFGIPLSKKELGKYKSLPQKPTATKVTMTHRIRRVQTKYNSTEYYRYGFVKRDHFMTEDHIPILANKMGEFIECLVDINRFVIKSSLVINGQRLNIVSEHSIDRCARDAGL